jgi:glycosyltransferase involved in cell wall biosynthesis
VINSKPKYSVIVPVRNGGKYLPHCVDTIISQGFDNYELIISDDHSIDNTPDYLREIVHPNIKVIYPPTGLSMTEHWEWALSHAIGDWLIFVGQDDGLQPIFFSLAEILTSIAAKKKVRSIMSQRAYFFWPGCEAIYGNVAVKYRAAAKIKLLNCRYQALLSLLGFQTYFELPEMYTTSLFSKELIEEAKEKNFGKLLITHPQDANLAAIACSLDRHYLMSYIPLGWVGSSPKSAGMAVSMDSAILGSTRALNDAESVRKDYYSKMENSRLKIHPLAGEFSFGSGAVYFWNALLQTDYLRKPLINRLLLSNLFKTVMLAGVLADVRHQKKLNRSNRMRLLKDIIEINRCNYSLIETLSFMWPIFNSAYLLLSQTSKLFWQILKASCYYKVRWEDYPNITLKIASTRIEEMIIAKKIIEKLKIS